MIFMDDRGLSPPRRPQFDLIRCLRGATPHLEVVDYKPVAVTQFLADDGRNGGRLIDGEIGRASEGDDIRPWARVGTNSEGELRV